MAPGYSFSVFECSLRFVSLTVQMNILETRMKYLYVKRWYEIVPLQQIIRQRRDDQKKTNNRDVIPLTTFIHKRMYSYQLFQRFLVLLVPVFSAVVLIRIVIS